MLNLSKDESRLYNFVMEVINEVMDNYGYDYVIGNSKDSKYYTSNMEYIEITNNIDNTLEKCELISLGYYLCKRLGLEEVEVSISKVEEVCNMLNTLEVEYLSNIDASNIVWNIIYNETDVIGEGENNSFKIDVKTLLHVLMDNINKDALRRKLDVNIEALNEEEKHYALKIAQDLRLNNINTLINSEISSKFSIIIKEDTLNKGLLSVKDNATLEEVILDENEVIDYLLGNI